MKRVRRVRTYRREQRDDVTVEIDAAVGIALARC